jgi:hypothetical protein
LFKTGRADLRRMFFAVRARQRAGAILEPLQAIVAGVIDDHPEYHALLDGGTENVDRDFPPDTANPFLHLALHVALREQVAADRPAGVSGAHRALSTRLGSAVAAEHAMIECLGAALWSAQRDGVLPDEQAYLDCLLRLAARHGV